VKNPNIQYSSARKNWLIGPEARISAVSANWHGPCRYSVIGGTNRLNRPKRRLTMFANLNISHRVAAAVSALTLSFAMIAGTVTVPAAADTTQFASAYVSVLA
jgi:hypothetical protein